MSFDPEEFEAALDGQGDIVLQEVWRIKDELSAACQGDLRKLFAEAREREKSSGHRIIYLNPTESRAAAASK
jgi:hypothetical protein